MTAEGATLAEVLDDLDASYAGIKAPDPRRRRRAAPLRQRLRRQRRRPVPRQPGHRHARRHPDLGDPGGRRRRGPASLGQGSHALRSIPIPPRTRGSPLDTEWPWPAIERGCATRAATVRRRPVRRRALRAGLVPGDRLERDWKLGVAALVGIPLVVVVARVPDGPRQRGRRDRDRLRLERPDLPALHVRRPAASAVWALGVVATQLTSGKRPASQVFNIGVGDPGRRLVGRRVSAPGPRRRRSVRRGSWWR